MMRIIIVEDDPAILDTLSIILGDRYELQLYNSAELLMADPFDIPDLFIIDKQLSGASGAELCLSLKSSNRSKGVPVMLVSASPDIHRIAKAAGADAALEKPFSVKILRQMVSRLIGQVAQ